MSGSFQISADALGRIRLDGKRVTSAALPDNSHRVEAAVLMEVFHCERRDFRAAKAHLQPDCEDRAVAHSVQRVIRRRIEQQSCLVLQENKGGTVLAVNCRTLDFRDRIFSTWSCRVRSLKRLQSAESLRLTLDGAAPSISRMMRSQAMTALWSTWRSPS